MFLGGRARVGALSGVASRRSTTRRTQERLDTAKGKAEDLEGQIHDLEQQLTDELAQIHDKWEDVAGQIETKTVPLDRGDVRLDEVVLVWVPVA
jgi:hypothetical protein